MVTLKVSSSCELDLTGAEVFRWASVKSPESIYINCYYTIHERGINKPSNHSPPATVTVLGEIFYSCSSVLETVTAVFLVTESFVFKQIHFRNPSSVLVKILMPSSSYHVKYHFQSELISSVVSTLRMMMFFCISVSLRGDSLERVVLYVLFKSQWTLSTL